MSLTEHKHKKNAFWVFENVLSDIIYSGVF